MIKDFETVKQQLKELSDVINSFKSENVQLKIIELIFKGVKVVDETTEEDEDTGTPPPSNGGRKKAPRKKRTSISGEQPDKKGSAPKGRPGPTQIIESLIDSGFFNSKKLIGDIVQHCKTNMALTYKSTDISPILVKLVRDQKLKRVKNSESGQYEYSKA